MAEQSGQPAASMLTDDQAGGWERVWDFLTSPRCTAILILGIAFVSLLAGIFPQVPSTADAATQLRWLAEATARWGTLGPTLRALGLFQIATSPLWRALLGLGCFILLVNAAETLRRACGYAQADASALPPRARGQRLVDDDTARVIAAVDNALTRAGYHTRMERVGDTWHLHAVRTGWAAWLHFGTVLGLLLVVASLLASGALAHSEHAALGPGETVSLALRPGWSVALGDDNARGPRWTVVLRGPEGEPQARGEIGLQRPLVAGALTLHMTHSVTGVVVSATDGEGKPVALQAAGESSAAGTLFLRFDENQPEQYFAAPDVGDTVRIALHTNPAESASDFAFQIFHGTAMEPAHEGAFSDEATAMSDGITYRLVAGQYPAVVAVSDISRYPLWLGAVIAIACVVASAWATAHAALVQAIQADNRVALRYLASDAATEDALRKALG